MTMTLVERSIPPSPPQSSDGHPPHESFEGYGMYHPAYNSTKMSEEISTGQLQSMASLYFFMLPGNETDLPSTMVLHHNTSNPRALSPQTCQHTR